jgi:hypothetical protein
MSGSMPFAWIERPDGVNYRAVVNRKAPLSAPMGMMDLHGTFAEGAGARRAWRACHPAAHRRRFPRPKPRILGPTPVSVESRAPATAAINVGGSQAVEPDLVAGRRQKPVKSPAGRAFVKVQHERFQPFDYRDAP